MRAIAIDKFGKADQLLLKELPKPTPAPNEVLIKIAYSGVNPVDWRIREGQIQKLLPHAFPIILGWDAAGTIAEVGAKVTQFKAGDPVFAYCRKPTVQYGTYAEYIAFDADHVAPKPANLSFAEAAAIPLVALTAWQALFDSAKLQPNETILIHAGAGGVGGMAIQLAKNAGATVLTTTSEKNSDYVQKLGADVIINYREEDFVKVIEELYPDGVDVVLDCVGGETLARSYDVLKRKGRLFSIVNRPEKRAGITTDFVFVRPDGKELRKIGKLIESGKVIAPKIEELPLAEAAKAHAKSEAGHTTGKLVLKI